MRLGKVWLEGNALNSGKGMGGDVGNQVRALRHWNDTEKINSQKRIERFYPSLTTKGKSIVLVKPEKV